MYVFIYMHTHRYTYTCTHTVGGEDGEWDMGKTIKIFCYHQNAVVLLIWKDPILVYKQISQDAV